ncbi:MAG: helix-turn-helix transcriptional regulator [Planctomycetes bacterium]|nr:helix-turn-helix transcriptional regulator [Planctomycetota bacterium]
MADRPIVADPWEGVSAQIVHADLYPCGPAWRIERAICPYDGYFYIWKGRGWVEVDDERLDALPGDLFIIRRGRAVAAGHDQKHPMMPLSTGFHLLRNGRVDAIRHLALPTRLRLRPDDITSFHGLFMELVSSHHDPQPTARLTAAGALLRLVAAGLRLVHELPAERKSGVLAPLVGDDTMAARVQSWIDEHLADRITLATLARVAKLTPTHFAAAFRKQTGISPMHFVRCRRVEVSRTLLAAGDRPVEEVARAVGYPDPFHFSRVFRQHVQVSPSDYRDSIKYPFQS